MPFLLSRKDSNLDKQNQNLLCYHYTTRQPNHSPTPVGGGECGAKIRHCPQLSKQAAKKALPTPPPQRGTPPQIDIKEPALGDAVVSRGRALGGERQGSP